MKIYIVNAFTDKLFTGNQAGVCILETELQPELMQKIAAENHLSETAFIRKKDNGSFSLRWFTPKSEIDLCGHATLASAYIIMNFIERKCQDVTFDTLSGQIKVRRSNHGFQMTFPVRRPTKVKPTRFLTACLGVTPQALFASRDLLVILESEQMVRQYEPDYTKLQKLSQWLGIVITAKGITADFVSRYFCPELEMEDPVTGSSHCSLVPYWAHELRITEFYCQQLSPRYGELWCQLTDNSVFIHGNAILYLQGEMNI